MNIGVLDRGFRNGRPTREVLANLLECATRAERWGMSRFWLSEHHSGFCSYSSPELMVAAIAARTSRIRVGSAGVLLYFHKPWRIAECFRLLEAMHPSRIDLGVAAGLGGNVNAQQALSPGFDLAKAVESGLYAANAASLLDAIDARYQRVTRFSFEQPLPRFAPKREDSSIPAPIDCPGPPVVFLGSRTGLGNALLAAKHGRSFCYLLEPGMDSACNDVLKRYRDAFRPSEHLSEPHALLAATFAGAETDALARQWVLLNERLGNGEKARLVGSGQSCKRQIEDLFALYGVDEIILSPVLESFAQRMEGLEALMAETSPQPLERTGSGKRYRHFHQEHHEDGVPEEALA
jgi:luciferase family oxidoreductase group 1